jgi:sRNA-binding regulator protein Hfq
MRFQRPPFHHRRDSEPPNRPEYENEAGGSADEESEDDLRRESEYLRRLTDEHTPVVVHLRTGENFAGHIEYYDRRFIRLTREGAPNLFIFKNDIKYLSEG